MDDLDSLLADLQSTTSQFSHRVHLEETENRERVNGFDKSHYKHPSEDTEPVLGRSETPPLPPPPSLDILSSLDREQCHLEYSCRKTSLNNSDSENYFHSSSSLNRNNNSVTDSVPIKTMTSLTNNLSELDMLLQDLNSAQFLSESDKLGPRTVNSSTNQDPASYDINKPVDNLLNDLKESLGLSKSERSHYDYPKVDEQPQPRGGDKYAASSATRELDDIMASLSNFKMDNPVEISPMTQNATVNDAAIEDLYAKPVKSLSTPVSSGKPLQQTKKPELIENTSKDSQLKDTQSSQDNPLDSMLGTLQSDLNRQGISTATKGHCAACNMPIAGQVITALGKVWHVEHFVCAHCHQELGTKTFFERDGQVYCEDDYHTIFSPRCAYCKGPIIDKCVTALGCSWHPDHFFCSHCAVPFYDEGFHEKDGKAYCRKDYFEMFAPKCGRCGYAIMDQFISALNRQWHTECFVCCECNASFEGGSFFDHEGLPYCETHYYELRGSLCYKCHKPITSRCITAMQRKFHPEHFVCAFCQKVLNKGTFKEQNDKPYCHPCFVKLF